MPVLLLAFSSGCRVETALVSFQTPSVDTSWPRKPLLSLSFSLFIVNMASIGDSRIGPFGLLPPDLLEYFFVTYFNGGAICADDIGSTTLPYPLIILQFVCTRFRSLLLHNSKSLPFLMLCNYRNLPLRLAQSDEPPTAAVIIDVCRTGSISLVEWFSEKLKFQLSSDCLLAAGQGKALFR